MTGDEMERAIQFILEQQARQDARFSEKIDRLSGHVERISGIVDRLSDKVDRLSDKVDRTADSVVALLAIAEMHEREIASLNERGRETDERLNALINTVERYISERRNGQA